VNSLPQAEKEVRYRDAVDVKRAADLCAQGWTWTLHQIVAKLGFHWSTVASPTLMNNVAMAISNTAMTCPTPYPIRSPPV
jgi:uncharacterized protein YbjT (DUF2867 family)